MSDDPKQGEENEPAPKPEQDPSNQTAPATVTTDAEGNLTVPGPKPVSRGAQVILTGEAQDAARGGLSSTMEGNVLAKRALEADGTVADGYGPDGSTTSKKPPADAVVTEQGDPVGEVPATGETRVNVVPDVLETETEDKPKE